MKFENVSRRRFLKTAAGTAAAVPTVISASALGRDGAVAPSERINMGILGVGARGSGNMRMFLNYDDVRIAAICDVNKRNLDKARKLVVDKDGKDDVRIYHDFRKLNADPSIDAVMMAFPVHWHTIPSLDAIAHGKHIYYEKPMAMSFREAQLVRAAVKKKSVVFQFGTQQRSDIRFRWACALARNGRLGKMKKVEVGVPGGRQTGVFPEQPVPDWLDWDRWVGPAPAGPFHEDRLKRSFHEHISDYSLGFISCWGIHHLDIAQWGNGTQETGPVSVEGTGSFPKSGTCDAILNWRVRFEFKNAAPIEFSDKSHHEMGVRFIGDKTWAFANRGKITSGDKSFLRDPQNKEEAMPLKLPVSKDHYRDFIDAIKTGGKTVAGIDTAVRSDTLCQIALIAVKCGRKLQWDPVAEKFVNDSEANKMLLPRDQRRPWTLPESV